MRGGKILSMKVTPESRTKDVVVNAIFLK